MGAPRHYGADGYSDILVGQTKPHICRWQGLPAALAEFINMVLSGDKDGLSRIHKHDFVSSLQNRVYCLRTNELCPPTRNFQGDAAPSVHKWHHPTHVA